MVGERLATELPTELPDPAATDRSMLVLQYVTAAIALLAAVALAGMN